MYWDYGYIWACGAEFGCVFQRPWLFGGIFVGAMCLYFSVGALLGLYILGSMCVFDGEMGFCVYTGQWKNCICFRGV